MVGIFSVLLRFPPWLPRLVNLLASFQHFDELPNLPDSRLRLFHRLYAEKNRVAIRPIEINKERLRSRTGIQRRLQIFGNTSRLRRIIGSIPPSVFFRGIYGFQTGSLHASADDQAVRFSSINLRPDTFRRARNEALQPCFFAFTTLLSINPSITQGDLQRFTVGYRPLPRPFFRQPQPQTAILAMILLEPCGPLGLSRKKADRVILFSLHRVFSASRRNASPVNRTGSHPSRNSAPRFLYKSIAFVFQSSTSQYIP